ncbi:MAG TPA: hypothetical protein VN578_18115 [Candidatus Binatia bacterium]|jgi:hypothetical protein|nr:hypothetical protein [Candidatus Binatia bacterium]
MHIYENDSNSVHLGGTTLDGNVAFNAGSIQNVRGYRDWIVGVDAPALSADGIVLVNNKAYFPSVAVPNGPMNTAQPTGPTFNVFVLQPRLIRLRATIVDGQVEVSWPTNSGTWVLQSTPSCRPAARGRISPAIPLSRGTDS